MLMWSYSYKHDNSRGDQSHQADEIWQGCWYIPDRIWNAESLRSCRAQWIRDLIEDIIHFGKIPTKWGEENIISFSTRARAPPLNEKNYRGLNLLDQTMKVLERVAENFLWQGVRIDDMQFGFMPRRSTTDAIFNVRQLQEKFRAVDKTLYMAFVNLEKAFDHVPGCIIWWALHKLGPEAHTVHVWKCQNQSACWL